MTNHAVSISIFFKSIVDIDTILTVLKVSIFRRRSALHGDITKWPPRGGTSAIGANTRHLVRRGNRWNGSRNVPNDCEKTFGRSLTSHDKVG